MANQANASQAPKWRQICLETAGPAGTNPLFNFNLTLESGGLVVGVGEIIQKLTPPNNNIRFAVKGNYQLILDGANETYVISLTGEYMMHCPPPELCLFLVPFSASVMLNYKEGKFANGRGTFHYGKHQIAQEVVNVVECIR